MRGRGRAGARPGGRPHAAPQVMLHRNKNDVTQQRRRFGLGKARRANRRCTRQARMQRELQKTPHGGGGGDKARKKIRRGKRICGLGEGFLAMLSRTASPGSPRSPGKGVRPLAPPLDWQWLESQQRINSDVRTGRVRSRAPSGRPRRDALRKARRRHASRAPAGRTNRNHRTAKRKQDHEGQMAQILTHV